MATRSKFERSVAAFLLLLPALYVLSDVSPRPAFARWSSGQLAFLGAWIAGALAVLATYGFDLPRPLARLRRGLVAASLGCLAAVILLEVGLLILDDAPFAAGDNRGRHAPDPDVGHVFAPDHEQTLKTREYQIPFRSNAQGIRADVVYGPKPAGVRRVLCVGDSFTAGEQVPVEETWPAVLERLLNEDDDTATWEVVHAGFPGYCTANEARYLEKSGPRFDPDVVLPALTPNDLLENEKPLRLTARGGALVGVNTTDADARAWEARNHWTSLPGLVERTRIYALLQGSSLRRKLAKLPRFTHFRAYAVEQDDRAREQLASVQASLLDAREAAAELGANFALLVVPFREQLTELEPGLDPAILGERLREFAEAADFPAADALPLFRAHEAPRTLYWREDGHCTAAGYALLGQAAHTLLREHAEDLGLR